ncbi:MAG: glycosyltransferase [Mitsuokella sp.]
MRITACCIAKNEAANLPQWLASVRGYADAIVVVDTGSTDATAEIARAGGARVLSFPWTGDFAAAKNYAIEACGGDWIAFLDADEFFREEDVSTVRALVARYDAEEHVAGLATRLVNIDRGTGENMGTSMIATRLFRNRPWIRYVGTVHESLRNLRPALPQEMKYVESPVIYHTGYSRAIIAEKSARDLAMLLARQEKEGVQPLDDFHLADCYYSLKDYEKAAYHAERAAHDTHQPVGMEQRPYMVWAQSLMLLGRPGAEVRAVLHEAERRYPEAAAFFQLDGVACRRMGDFLAAEQAFLCALSLTAEHPDDDAAARLLPLTYEHLGEIALRKGDKETARALLAEGLRLQVRHGHMLQLLAEACEGLADADVIALLNGLFDKARDAGYLAQMLAGTRLGRAALYYDHAAGGVLGRMDRLLLAGRPEPAAAQLVEELERTFVLADAALHSAGTDAAHGAWQVLMPNEIAGGAKENERLRKRMERTRLWHRGKDA